MIQERKNDMASIIKRKKNYSVVYNYVDENGETKQKWGVFMYDGQTALIANYINPIIGDMEVQAVTPRAVDGYIQTLQKTKSVSTKTRKAVTTYVSDKTIEKIIKLLRCAFKQAVRWEIIARNPFDNVILPKTEYAKRDIRTSIWLWRFPMDGLARIVSSSKSLQSSVRTQGCRRWSFILYVIPVQPTS